MWQTSPLEYVCYTIESIWLVSQIFIGLEKYLIHREASFWVARCTYNWYLSSIQSFQYIHEHELQCSNVHDAFPLLWFPLANSLLLTWNPPSCDRNRPPQTRVACKLTPLVLHLAPVPSLPKFQPPLGFPSPNVHLIRAPLQTWPIDHAHMVCNDLQYVTP